MPYQPVDFGNFAQYILQQQQQNQPPDMMERFKAGYNLSQLPGQTKRRREEEELKLAMDRLKLEQAQMPKEMSWEDRIRQQQYENYETPEQKFNREKAMKAFQSALNREEEGVKSGYKRQEEAAKTKEDITTATKTRYEKNIDSADTLDAVLDELEKYENPSLTAPWIFGDVGNRNKYKTLVTSGIEKLMSGENWLGIAPNVEKAQEMLSITPRETVAEYRDRIKSIRARVKKEKEATILKQGKKGKSPDDPFGLR